MSAFKVNFATGHAESLLALINHDNAATIVAPLDLAGYALSNQAKQEDESYTTLVTNKDYTADTVEVNYTKLAIADFISMTEAGDDFDWYKPDDWDESTHVSFAIEAFKAAATRDGVDPAKAFDNISVVRTFDDSLNRFVLTFTVESFVWKETVEFVMPRHFSEEIVERDLVGFVFTPIDPAAVVK